jgi:GNAT superfamily N-acetyltransferase
MDESFVIRPAVPNDETFLWEALYHAVYVPAGSAPLPRDIVRLPEIGRYVSGWGRPGDRGVVAVIADQPVGAAWLRLWMNGDRGFGYVDDQTPELSIAVLPEFRGCGVGSRLMAGILELANEKATDVSLSVTAENPAVRLYRRFGFETVEIVGDSLTMVKRWRIE